MNKKFGVSDNAVEVTLFNKETGEKIGVLNTIPSDFSITKEKNKVDYNKTAKLIKTERKQLTQFEQLKKNILSLNWSMDDAPYFGLSGDQIKTIKYSIQKILEGTGLTIEELLKESNEKDWFSI